MNNSRRRPVSTAKADPEVLARALELAEGDRRRLVIEEDGSVTVLNNPRRGA
jgi:hypothetical protein